MRRGFTGCSPTIPCQSNTTLPVDGEIYIEKDGGDKYFVVMGSDQTNCISNNQLYSEIAGMMALEQRFCGQKISAKPPS